MVDPTSPTVSTSFLVAAAGSGSDPTRVVLLAVILLLTAILIGLAALLVAVRRRGREPAVAEPAPAPPPRPAPRPASPPPRSAVRRPLARSGSAGGGLQVATSGMVCPTCRTEYAGMTYCQRDARRLVSAEDILSGGRGPGGLCVSCRRAFDPGLRRCPHDGADIIPAPLYWATRGRRDRDLALTGVNAKICPSCRRRYDLAVRFCGRDGTELVVVN